MFDIDNILIFLIVTWNQFQSLKQSDILCTYILSTYCERTITYDYIFKKLGHMFELMSLDIHLFRENYLRNGNAHTQPQGEGCNLSHISHVAFFPLTIHLAAKTSQKTQVSLLLISTCIFFARIKIISLCY